MPGRLTDSKPGSRVELVDAYGRPIGGTGAGSTTGSGSYPGYTTDSTGGGSFPIGSRPGSYSQQNGVTAPGGSGSFLNGHGGSGPGSGTGSYSNGRPNGTKIVVLRYIKTIYHM